MDQHAFRFIVARLITPPPDVAAELTALAAAATRSPIHDAAADFDGLAEPFPSTPGWPGRRPVH